MKSELNYGPEDIQLGNRLATAIGLQTAAELVATSVDAIAHAGHVAIIGFGWGATVALRAAQSLSLPCIVYCDMDDVLGISEQTNIPILVHSSSPRGREYLPRDHSPTVHVQSHAAANGFYRADDTQHHHPQSAQQAMHDSKQFLRAHIRRDER